MRYWTVSSMMPSSGVRSLVALSVLSLVCASASWAYQDLSIRDPSPENLPDWWLPIICSVKASNRDTNLCGFGLIQGYGNLFLAHKVSIGRLLGTIMESDDLFGNFMFKPNATVDLTKPLAVDEEYKPSYRAEFHDNIEMYQAKIWLKNFYPKSVPSFKKYPPAPTSVRMETDENAVPKNCFVMTYAYEDELTVERWPYTTGKVKFISVALSKEKGCNGTMCYMVTASLGKGSGNLCGRVANLGNPVICGEKPNLKVTYLIDSLGWQDRGRFNCTNQFRASKVAPVCNKLGLLTQLRQLQGNNTKPYPFMQCAEPRQPQSDLYPLVKKPCG